MIIIHDYHDPSHPALCGVFSVDISNLLPEYGLHFDLYNTAISKRNSNDIGSHDDAACVPEPGSLVLLGLGLIVLFISRYKFLTKKSQAKG